MLVYRAVWSEPSEGLCDRAIEAARAWVLAKSQHSIDLPDHGIALGEAIRRAEDRRQGWRSWTVAVRAEVTQLAHRGQLRRGVRVAFREDWDDTMSWTTVLTAWEPTPHTVDPLLQPERGWIWVDIERELGEESAQWLHPVAAPKLVRRLLGYGAADSRSASGHPVSATARSCVDSLSAVELGRYLVAADRALPAVVVATPSSGGSRGAATALTRTAEYLAGVCTVHEVSAAAMPALAEVIGGGLTVEPGDYRLCVPGLIPHDPRDVWRHPRHGIVRKFGDGGSWLDPHYLSQRIAREAAPFFTVASLPREARLVERALLSPAADGEAVAHAAGSGEAVGGNGAEIPRAADELAAATRWADALQGWDQARSAVLALRSGDDASSMAAPMANYLDAIDRAEVERPQLAVMRRDSAGLFTTYDTAHGFQARAWALATWIALRSLAAYADTRVVDGFSYFAEWLAAERHPFARLPGMLVVAEPQKWVERGRRCSLVDLPAPREPVHSEVLYLAPPYHGGLGIVFHSHPTGRLHVDHIGPIWEPST